MEARVTAMPERLVMDFIKEWWAVIAFVIANLSAFFMGQQQTRWRVHQVGEKVSEMAGHIQQLETASQETSRRLAVIESALSKIDKIDASSRETALQLAEIQGELRQFLKARER